MCVTCEVWLPWLRGSSRAVQSCRRQDLLSRLSLYSREPTKAQTDDAEELEVEERQEKQKNDDQKVMLSVRGQIRAKRRQGDGRDTALRSRSDSRRSKVRSAGEACPGCTAFCSHFPPSASHSSPTLLALPLLQADASRRPARQHFALQVLVHPPVTTI